MMKKLAVFVYFNKDGVLCPNALLYIKELLPFFDTVIVSSNIKVNIPGVISYTFENDSYDFGFFYKALKTINAYDNYNVIGFFNDSNYIINSMQPFINWAITNNLDLCGITDSNEGRPEIKRPDQYHIQSHVMVFKNSAVSLLKEFFSVIDMENMYKNIKDAGALRASIIIKCEIELSYFMKNNSMKIGSYFSANQFIPKVSKLEKNINMHVILWKQLIDNGYPLVKRKIINNSFPRLDTEYLATIKEMFPIKNANLIIQRKGNTEYIKTI